MRDGSPRRTKHGESGVPRRLTPAEDSELRQLTWFAKAGQLSEEARARLDELRARDRRDEVRDPRPDPISKVLDQRSARLIPQESVASTCSNCGFALTETRRAACPNCGFNGRTSPVEIDLGSTQTGDQ